MSRYRISKWTYNTAASGSISIGYLTASRGFIVLDDPAGTSHRFNVASMGFGYGKRVASKAQLPDVPLPATLFNGNTLGGGGATSDFSGNGFVAMTPAFLGSELKPNDFVGATNQLDAGAGLLVAYGFTFVFSGIPQSLMLGAIANPAFMHGALNSAKALIVMRGMSEGLIDGGSFSSSVGMLTYQGTYSG
jgi:hypothetical protein